MSSATAGIVLEHALDNASILSLSKSSKDEKSVTPSYVMRKTAASDASFMFTLALSHALKAMVTTGGILFNCISKGSIELSFFAFSI
jgi:hypothetical protein